MSDLNEREAQAVDLYIKWANGLADTLYRTTSIGDIITLMANHHSGAVPITDAETRFAAIGLTKLMRDMGPLANLTPAQATDLLTDRETFGQCDECGLAYELASNQDHNPETGNHWECE